MTELNPFVLFTASIFTSNMILANFLGMCSFIAVSKDIKTSLGLGQAVTFVLTFTTVINYFLYKYVLIPMNLEYLRYIVFIISIAAFVQLVEMIVERHLPVLHHALGIFLPLITVNCAILGVSLFMVIRRYSFIQSLAFGFGSGVGWTMAIVALAGLKKRLNESRVPKGLRGGGITLIITGLMALGFMGFSGMVQIS
ncbi:MAG: NADH:ubiquinone reductase (Na(+)-transporting) subunit E [Peptostreptococcaceae bacterium]|nr:NADH:ubiquinone reductase (Na(+)-transporting) subunit E [Peptostreptococcaceae bacterium]